MYMPLCMQLLSTLKVTGYSCARRAKCIGKCILKLANQKSRVRREWATWFWRWRCAVTRCRAWRKLLRIRCIAVQKRAVQFTKKPYLPLFSSETADKFAKDYAIKKSFRHALRLVTVHLHRQNQVSHALRTRDFWLGSLSMHFPIHFGRRAHEYPVTLILSNQVRMTTLIQPLVLALSLSARVDHQTWHSQLMLIMLPKGMKHFVLRFLPSILFLLGISCRVPSLSPLMIPLVCDD